jgi:4-hydroxy-tetrahydrodipicolinate synthase
MLRKTLSGVGTALVTPFKKDESVDFDALGNLIDIQITAGINYVVTLGTTGESVTLSESEKLAVLEYTYERVNGRIPVVVGIGGNNTASVVELLSKYPLEKATAILSVTPYYNKPSQEGLFLHYSKIADAAPKPILLYNVPGRTGKNMTAETSLRLAAHPNIGGIKEAGPAMAQTIDLLKDRPSDFLVVSGDDEIVMAQIACGMDGVISVASNAFPKPFGDMIRYAQAGDFSMAKRVNDLLVEGYALMYEENNPAGIKAFLAEQGVIENVLRLPLTSVNAGLQQKIHTFLQRFAD